MFRALSLWKSLADSKPINVPACSGSYPRDCSMPCPLLSFNSNIFVAFALLTYIPEIEKCSLVIASLPRPAAIPTLFSPRREILEFLHPLQMAGTQTVAQLLRQQLLIGRKRDQLDAFDLGAGLGW